MNKKHITLRIDSDNQKKLERTLELRNGDNRNANLSDVSRSEIINEAIAHYYAYLFQSDDLNDAKLNKLYELELQEVMKNYMKPIYSMFNLIKYQNDILLKVLNYIFNTLDRHPDESEIRFNYDDLFELDKIIQAIEKEKNNK